MLILQWEGRRFCWISYSYIHISLAHKFYKHKDLPQKNQPSSTKNIQADSPFNGVSSSSIISRKKKKDPRHRLALNEPESVINTRWVSVAINTEKEF